VSKRVISIMGGAAVSAALFFASTASAATLLGDYQFQGNLASSGPGPALTDIGAGNTFQGDSVFGVSRQVQAFPQGNGLQMNPFGVASGSSYSVVATLRLTTLGAAYKRVLDTANGTSDAGLYVYDGKVDYYNAGSHRATTATVTPNTYATVALVANGPAGPTQVYTNGTLSLSYSGYGPVTGGTLRFFKDNTTGGATAEESAGAISCARVYSGALSAPEVATISTSPTCGTVAPPTKANKCKKHKKKKRSAESAKKKKCKKHKKKH
jgi:OOP family OmpA-OmpF porin